MGGALNDLETTETTVRLSTMLGTERTGYNAQTLPSYRSDARLQRCAMTAGSASGLFLLESFFTLFPFFGRDVLPLRGGPPVVGGPGLHAPAAGPLELVRSFPPRGGTRFECAFVSGG